MSLRFPNSVERFLRHETFLIAGILALALCAKAQQISPVPIECGKYSMAQIPGGYTCRRIGHVPWFAAQRDVWETEVVLRGGSAPVYWSWEWDRSGLENLWVWNRISKFHASDGGSSDLGARASYTLRILGRQDCSSGGCTTSPSAQAVGASLNLTADGLSESAVDAASGSHIYKFFAGESILSETAVPIIFLDTASSRWNAVITETPLSQQGQKGATSTAFAVKNLEAAQAVRVTLFDAGGTSVASVLIPEYSKWSASIVETPLSLQIDNPAVTKTAFAAGDAERFPIGRVPLVFPLPVAVPQQIKVSVYDEEGNLVASKIAPPPAAMLSEFLGFDLPVRPGETEFRGTLVFEGMKGYKIAPTVLRTNWPAVTAVPVKAE